MKIAIYAGSFDPLTNGHLWVIKEGVKLFDKLIIVVAHNPSKKGYFTPQQRVEFIQAATSNFPQVEVLLLSEDYVAQKALELNATYLLRGIRNGADYEYEKTIERINQKINPKLQTVYLNPPAELSEISSSIVKSLVGFPGWQKLVASMVPKEVVSGFLYQQHLPFLKNEWEKLVGTSTVSAKWLEIILTKHSESHRYYHNTNHLVDLLKQMNDLPIKNSLTTMALKFAVFFHDLVYDPKSKQNELDSKNLFTTFSKEYPVDASVASLVEEMILATSAHFKQPNQAEVNYFLDLDLSILGSSAKAFTQYEQAIREEYNFVPEDIYQVERAKIMKTLLNPYKTEWGKNKYNNLATLNLERYKS
jgi:pantetheine-phosphate adenylyltransferase